MPRFMSTFSLTSLLVALATPAVTLAQHATDAAHTAAAHVADHAHHADPGPIPAPKEGAAAGIAAIVVFVVVFALLAKFVWPSILKALDERETKIRTEIEAAESVRAEAMAALDRYNKSLAEARTQAQQMIEQAKAQMNAQIAEMKTKADADVAAMKSKALIEIEAAKKQALADIYSHTATLATNVAGKILKREVNSSDNARLLDEALAGLKNN